MNDPVINLLKELNFDGIPLFDELVEQQTDKELCIKYFKMSTEVALFHLLVEFDAFDTHPSNAEDHIAMRNLIKWVMMKFSSDPVWFSYLGWFMWGIASSGHADTYHPLLWHPKFVPTDFYNRTDKPTDVMDKTVRPHEVFKVDLCRHKPEGNGDAIVR